MARRLARDIAREVPACTVEPTVAFLNDAWTFSVRLPAGVNAGRFAAGMRSEGLPCWPSAIDGAVLLPLCTSYSTEDIDHMILGVAKVAHYLQRDP